MGAPSVLGRLGASHSTPFAANLRRGRVPGFGEIQEVAVSVHTELRNLLNQDVAAGGETTKNFVRFGNGDSDSEESLSESCRIPRSASSSFFFSSLARINSTWATFSTAQHEVGTQHGLESNFELAYYDVSVNRPGNRR